MIKRSRLLMVLVALALVAVACGDSDTAGDDSATTAAPATTEAPGDDASGESADTTAAPADEEPMDDEPMALPGEGVSVVSARANWSTGYMQAAIYAELLRELGYDVSEPADLELPPSNFFTALGEGEIDYWANSWYPGHAAWWNNELTDGSLVGEKVSVLGEEMLAGGLQGFLTNPSIVADNPGLTMDMINDSPELIALYDAADTSPGDGIVQILGCPEDWTCDDIINEQIAFAGWTNIEQTKAGYDAMVAEAVNRADAGDPFIIYTWTPSGYVTQLIPGDNAMWLAMDEESILDGTITPEFNQLVDTTGDGTGDTAVAAAMGLDVCSNDPCHLGWIAADIQVSANNEFLAANPAAQTLFELVQISVVDVALQNVLYDGGENTTGDVNRHAGDWIAANRDAVDEWLAAAIAAAG